MLRKMSTPARFAVAAPLTFSALVAGSVFAQRQLGTGFLPDGFCFTWIPGLLWLNVVSDGPIALAYLSIPLTLVYFIRHRPDLPFSRVYSSRRLHHRVRHQLTPGVSGPSGTPTHPGEPRCMPVLRQPMAPAQYADASNVPATDRDRLG